MAVLAREPGLEGCERFAAHAYEAPLPIGAPLNETSAFEHLEVARNRRRADVEWRGDVTDLEFAL